jgi:hypothetical protein
MTTGPAQDADVTRVSVRPSPWRQLGGLLVATVAGVVGLPFMVHDRIGSGTRCEGIGFGCTPEREIDTLLVTAVYAGSILLLAVVVCVVALSGRRTTTLLAGGVVVVALLTALTFGSQLPRYHTSTQPLATAVTEAELVLSSGHAPATGTPLATVLDGVRQAPPQRCLDAYERATGGWQVTWSYQGNPYRGVPEAEARTASALREWVDALRSQQESPVLSDDRAGGVTGLYLPTRRPDAGSLYLDARYYMGQVTLKLDTGCHRRD